MEFFCDSGIPIAYGLPDSFSKNCKIHFEKYPVNQNKYYYCIEVKQEFTKKRSERRRMMRKKSQFERIVEIESRSFFSFAIEKNFHKDKNFNLIKESIHEQLSDKTGKPYVMLENDAKILSNCILWSINENPNLPYFLTIDYNDIVKNKEFIINATNNILKTKIKLEFMYLL